MLIARAEPARNVDFERVFMVVGPDDEPRAPEDMIETQPIRIVR